MIHEFRRATLPESFQDIRNPTRPGAIGGIHATSSSDFSATEDHVDAEPGDVHHLSMAERYACRVLAVVAGSNADVVGSALSAFLAGGRGNVDELHVLTSARGGARLRGALLRSPTGSEPLTDVCNRLGIARGDILFGSRTIHLLGAEETPSFGPAADDMLEAVGSLCKIDSEVAIVAAPDAGPFEILAHTALQLVGGPKDRFYVLEFEPAPRGGRGTVTDARRRRPVLSELPLVLAPQPLEKADTFQKLAESRRLARNRLAEPGCLYLNGKRRTIRVGETEVAIPRLQFFWLFAFAILAPGAFPLKSLTGNFHVDPHGRLIIASSQPDRAALEAVVATVKRAFTALFPDASDEFPRVMKQACGPSPGLPSIVAKINARLKHVLGIGATPYLVAGGRSTEGYRLTLRQADIRPDPQVSPVQARG